MSGEEQIGKDTNAIRRALACQDYADALRLLDLMKTYAEPEELPKDFKELEQDAYRIGIQMLFLKAKDFAKGNAYEGAQKTLELLVTYADRAHIEVPQSALELRKDVYEKDMWVQLGKAIEEEQRGSLPVAKGYLVIAEHCAKQANVRVPPALSNMKTRIEDVLRKKTIAEIQNEELDLLQDAWWKTGNPEMPVGSAFIYCRTDDTFVYKRCDFNTGINEEGYSKDLNGLLARINPDMTDIIETNSRQNLRKHLAKLREAYKNAWQNSHTRK